MTAADFHDMMPHRIKVRSGPTYDARGRKSYSGAFTTYKCLFDDSISVQRSSTGEAVTITRTAYIDTEGEALTADHDIVFEDNTSRPVVSIQNNYDETGAVHNVTVTFS